jgi:hypothetical protein
MALQNQLLQKRPAILARWFECILATYAPQTASFLQAEGERFQNPVGETIRPALAGVFDALLDEAGDDVLRERLDPVIRIRAVQDFSAAGAVAFVFDLKQVVREELAGSVLEGAGEAWRDFDLQVDHAGLVAFDVYMRCREQIYDLRARELQRRTAAILRRHNYVIEDPESEPRGGPDPDADGRAPRERPAEKGGSDR